jgi:hypothetical protein
MVLNEPPNSARRDSGLDLRRRASSRRRRMLLRSASMRRELSPRGNNVGMTPSVAGSSRQLSARHLDLFTLLVVVPAARSPCPLRSASSGSAPPCSAARRPPSNVVLVVGFSVVRVGVPKATTTLPSRCWS